MITFTLCISHGAATPAYAVDGPASTVAITRSVPAPELQAALQAATHEAHSRLAEIDSRAPRPSPGKEKK